MNHLFSQDPINEGRQKELDLARGLAVFFMVAIHVLQIFATVPVEHSTVGELISFLGGPPGAPVFMFLMGVGIVYSRRSTPNHLWKRGVILLGLGYLLNLLRDTLPNGLAYVFQMQDSFSSGWSREIVSVDILPFAGLAFLFFAFVKKIHGRPWLLVIFLVIFSVINLWI